MPVKSNYSQKYYFEKSFDLPNPGLRAYFRNVVSGQPEEYRTTFYRGKSIDSVLRGWNKTLKRLEAQWPSLYEFEIDLGEKVGPMSIMKPLSERLDDIDAYYDLILKDQKPILEDAILACQEEWGHIAGVPIRSQFQTMLKMRKSTNSGSPFFTKRNLVTTKTIPCAVGVNGKAISQYLNGKVWYGAAVLGWRGQEGGRSPEDVKQRVVWMFPYAANIEELRVYQPLIEAFQRYNTVPAWVSMEAVDREVTRLFDTKGPDDLIVCTDFSKFDQHFNKECQYVAKRLIKFLMSDDYDMGYWLKDVFPIKYRIPLAFDYGKVRFGEHGMASGSGGTNADETLLHRSLQHEAAIINGEKLNPHSQCLGDDGMLSYPGITVDDVVRAYSSHGLEMNVDKQYASKQECIYLRRWHHKDYRINGVCAGVYSTNRALGRLMEQERYYDPEKWSNKMVALRQLSILENVKYHPLRNEFAEYCMKGDKFRLGLDIPGFLDNIESEAKKATEYMPDFLGYTKSLQGESLSARSTGIADWWIVKYLKSLR